MTALTTSTAQQPITTTTPWSVVVDVFLDAAVDSPHTRRAYARHLRDAFNLFGVRSVDGVTGADLARYRATVINSSLSPSSQGQALAALRKLLKWSKTMQAHYLPGDVIDTALKTPRAEVQHAYASLEDAEAAALLAAAKTSRDRAILGVMLGGGLRVAEVVALDPRSLLIDGDGAAALHVQGKGRKERIVPIQQDVAQLIRVYLAEGGRTLTSSGALFLAADRAGNRGRLTDNAIRQLVRRLAADAGITAKSVSPHSLRHTYGYRHYAASKNLLALQQLLGHSAVTTTQRYVAPFKHAELRATVPALPAI